MSIAEKLTYLNTTKQLLKTEINKINNVLDDNSTFRSYPQELFNGYLDILNNGTDTLWNNLTKVSQTGTEPVLENVETAPMKMVLNGNTSQDGTPTPDTPVKVKVVKGENVVSVSGKNLFDKDNANIVNVYANNNIFNSGWKYSTIYIPCTPNTTYTISREVLENNFVAATSVEVPVANGNYTNRIANNTGTEITITSGANDRYLSVYVKYEGDTSYTLDEILSTLQIELGSTATPYVPHSKTDYPINLGDIELCKINTYKDFPFKAKNGDEYYDTLTEEQKNALNYGSWYKHKEIQKYAITGQENWIKFTNYFFKAEGLFFNSKFVTGYGLCNQYVYNPTQTGLYASSSNNQFFLQYDRSYCHLFIRNDDYNDVTSWVSYLQSISNSILIYYPLATPTEEEITNTTLIEQLEAISKAKSVKDKTYITQTNDELPFILDVQAIKEYEVN